MAIDAFQFESDLISPPSETDWNCSFECWWIRKVLHEAYGKRCMNPNCRMHRKEDVKLELTQIDYQRNNIFDLMNLTNYQLVCRYCKSNPHMLFAKDVRPNDWQARIGSIKSIDVYMNNSVNIRGLDVMALKRELKDRKIYCNYSPKELQRFLSMACLISDFSHKLVNIFSRKDLFTHRFNKYEMYLKMLSMPDTKFIQIIPNAYDICYRVYGLESHSVLGYLVSEHGGISRTSRAYAVLEHEYNTNPIHIVPTMKFNKFETY